VRFLGIVPTAATGACSRTSPGLPRCRPSRMLQARRDP